MAAIFGALKYILFLNGKHTSVSNVLYRFWGWKTHFWYQNNDPRSHTRVKGHFKVISKMAAIFGALKYILFLNGKHTSVSNVLYRFWGWKTHFWYQNYDPRSFTRIKGHFKVIERLFQWYFKVTQIHGIYHRRMLA